MQLENQVLRQIALVPPDNPANTSVDKTKLMTASVDGFDSRKLEIPPLTGFGVREWGNEASRCSINVDGNVIASLLLIGIQDIVDLFYWFIVACVSATQDDKNAYSVLIDVLLHQLGVQTV